ncbi:MAG: SPOR domain-containing protein, partial [Pseudomonadota bacterium]|nr:SPOR domain-containing protein [Pseudomonadota bacterium]
GNTTDSNGSEVVSSGALSDQQSAQGAKSNSDGVNDNVTPTTVASESSQEGWIGENDYAIQLLAMKSESVLSEFLRENNLTEQTRIYKTTRYGGDWFVVVNKQIYTSLSQAQQARKGLPEYPGKQNAFIKRGNQILSEMSKAQN